MKALSIMIIVVIGTLADLAILAAGVWLTFFLHFSFLWWFLVVMLSWGETLACYKFVNAINGKQIPFTTWE